MTLSVSMPTDQSFEQVLQSVVADEWPPVPHLIAGNDSDNNPVTLIGTSLANYSFSGGLREWRIDALAAVHGLQVSSWTQQFIYAVLIKPHSLHRWFGRQLIQTEDADSGRPAFRAEEQMDFDLPLEDGVRIRFHDGALSSFSLDEYRLRHDSQIWFHFEQSISLSELTDRWLPWLTRLLGILIGRPIDLEAVSVFTTDPYTSATGILGQEGRLLRSKPSIRSGLSNTDMHPAIALAPFASVRDQLPDIVNRWNRISRLLEPAVALFSVVAFHHSLYLEARFLTLVQALEIFHACSERFSSTELTREEHQSYLNQAREAIPRHLWDWARGKLALNSRSLGQKLTDIFQAYAPFSERLLGDIGAAASRISYTRNFHTHHIDNPNRNRLIPDDELVAVSWALEALLWVVLLLEIGIEGEAVDRVIRRAEGVRFVNIEGNYETPE